MNLIGSEAGKEYRHRKIFHMSIQEKHIAGPVMTAQAQLLVGSCRAVIAHRVADSKTNGTVERGYLIPVILGE